MGLVAAQRRIGEPIAVGAREDLGDGAAGAVLELAGVGDHVDRLVDGQGQQRQQLALVDQPGAVVARGLEPLGQLAGLGLEPAQQLGVVAVDGDHVGGAGDLEDGAQQLTQARQVLAQERLGVGLAHAAAVGDLVAQHQQRGLERAAAVARGEPGLELGLVQIEDPVVEARLGGAVVRQLAKDRQPAPQGRPLDVAAQRARQIAGHGQVVGAEHFGQGHGHRPAHGQLGRVREPVQLDARVILGAQRVPGVGQVGRHLSGVEALRIDDRTSHGLLLISPRLDLAQDRLALTEGRDPQPVAQVLVPDVVEVLERDLVALEGLRVVIEVMRCQPGLDRRRHGSPPGRFGREGRLPTYHGPGHDGRSGGRVWPPVRRSHDE